MNLLFDAFWRAVAYCLHPKVIVLSLLPLLLAAGLSGGLAYFYWESAVDGLRATLDSWLIIDSLLRWLGSIGGEGFRTVLVPIIIIALAVPVIVVVSLVLVALLMTPALVTLVANRRFPNLERRKGAAIWQSVLWSLGCTVAALFALLLSVPLWLIPPLVMILPPLIWGWLSFRVFAFDVLADHASTEERRQLMREHRAPMLLMGVICGYLGAAPSLVWAFGVIAVVLWPLLVVVTVWIYTLVFAFAALWFAHYALAALEKLRMLETVLPPAADGSPPAAELPGPDQLIALPPI
ncbi:MAG: EI24 domain-containing protein [Burkholderiaceae bacterium]|nr:EI24 domain-containing protein [Burkholderiaceae bacterium]